MFQDHSDSDTFTVHKPSPWPLVGGIVAIAALVCALVVAFGS
jgi:hypothetical protein